MPNQMVRDLVSELPWAMRNSVEGYVDAVAAVLPDIEREAGLRLPRAKADEFLFMVAVRRIWASVNSQYWIINDGVSIAESRGLRGFQAGRDGYARGSEAAADSRNLRSNFQKLVAELGIEHLVIADSLEEMLRAMSLDD
jgi:hypothetical protein